MSIWAISEKKLADEKPGLPFYVGADTKEKALERLQPIVGHLSPDHVNCIEIKPEDVPEDEVVL